MCHGSFGFTTEKTKIISSLVHISTSPILKFEKKKRKGAVIICILDISESIIW